VVLDLSEVSAVEGGGLGMLIFLQRWTHDHDIGFKLFNPSRYVREKLEMVSAMSEFDIASLHEMMALLGQEDRSYRLAA
jgi:anti-anti-sigma regulatory factor